MNTKEEPDLFEKLSDSLYSWKIDISRDKKARSFAQWDIVLQTSENLKTATTWLEWQKGFDYAEGFNCKFKSLYKDVKNFYEKLEKGEMNEEDIFHEQIPILEDSAKKLAEYVLTVKYFCENDRRAQEEKGNINVNISGDVKAENVQIGHDASIHKQAVTEQNKSTTKCGGTWICLKKIPRWFYYLLASVAALLTILHLLGWLEPIKSLFTR